MNIVEGKIAAIVNDRTVVVNRGTSHKVKIGMVFAIKLVLPPVTDPDDPTSTLDGVYFEKGRFRITTVFDKMSFGLMLGVPGRSETEALSGILGPKTVYPEVAGSILVDASSWAIREGDLVIQVAVPDQKD